MDIPMQSYDVKDKIQICIFKPTNSKLAPFTNINHGNRHPNQFEVVQIQLCIRNLWEEFCAKNYLKVGNGRTISFRQGNMARRNCFVENWNLGQKIRRNADFFSTFRCAVVYAEKSSIFTIESCLQSPHHPTIYGMEEDTENKSPNHDCLF
ncbi:hypothetical protein HAX54_052672 [Datura stramonium]|uniref:Uncharacterized protein n=1 Tax=Datura stramonium TaxID=4076 RepID=A0ABS8SZB1_DATST|nr:hypothetical protein [Datura stramonium]